MHGGSFHGCPVDGKAKTRTGWRIDITITGGTEHIVHAVFKGFVGQGLFVIAAVTTAQHQMEVRGGWQGISPGHQLALHARFSGEGHSFLRWVYPPEYGGSSTCGIPCACFQSFFKQGQILNPVARGYNGDVYCSRDCAVDRQIPGG